MSHAASNPRNVVERIGRIRTNMAEVLRRRKNARLEKLWGERQPALDRMLKECAERPQVSISLVGGTGAGKSTLLNALLDARILPVSNMRACTAAISEVGYREGHRYEAEIHFVSRDVWQREIEQLWADLADARHGDNGEADPDGEALAIPRIARDKLWAVYRPTLDADPALFDPYELNEVPDIRNALNAGIERVESDDLEEFRKGISVYLDSKHRYWPIVRAVRIRGPFESLKNGVTLVDLPGINDPNEAREEVTRNYLKTCRFVWIVFNIKRVLTKDTMSLMQSEDFLRQIVMDGRAGALTLVGTASDDVDLETGREEFGLDEDASEADVVLKRNKAVRHEVQRQLEELSDRLVRMAGEDAKRGKALAAAFGQSKVFTISAREYMRLRGLSKTRPSGLESLDQTEVVQLRRHLDTISAEYGIEARAKAHHRQLDLLLKEIEGELKTQQAVLEQRVEFTQRQRKEVGAAVETARTFLEAQLKDAQERYAQALESDQAVLTERLKRSLDRATLELDSVMTRWSRMNHNTLKATARRGGSYTGSTGKYDLAGDLAKPILDGITFAWSDFFGDKLNQSLERWNQRLLSVAESHRQTALQGVARIDGIDADLGKSLDNLTTTTERVLKELLGQIRTEMTQKIENVQRTLYEHIPGEIQANMQQAFTEAAQQAGTGMKARMVAILGRHAKQVSTVMFQDVQDTITSGVRGLSDWLGHKFGDMVDSVRRQSGIAAENLRLDVSHLSGAQIDEEEETLREVRAVVSQLFGSDEALVPTAQSQGEG